MFGALSLLTHIMSTNQQFIIHSSKYICIYGYGKTVEVLMTKSELTSSPPVFKEIYCLIIRIS